MSTFITILVILGVIGIIILSVHNSIIGFYNACQRAWADVITQELQKNRVLPKLEETLASYNLHESSIMKTVTELRTELKGISAQTADIETVRKINEQSTALIANLNAVAENYPDLKASNLYQGFMKEFSTLERDIAASIRIFNANVEKFNTKIEVFPNVLINNMLTKKTKMNVFTDSQAAAGFEYKPNF